MSFLAGGSRGMPMNQKNRSTACSSFGSPEANRQAARVHYNLPRRVPANAARAAT
jgi:hypothetical protein